MKILVIYLIIVNLIAFFLFGADKRRARNHSWRVSERALFLVAVAGGSIGALAGMFWFHHKTKHWYFRVGLPLILLVQAGAALVLYLRYWR